MNILRFNKFTQFHGDGGIFFLLSLFSVLISNIDKTNIVREFRSSYNMYAAVPIQLELFYLVPIVYLD